MSAEIENVAIDWEIANVDSFESAFREWSLAVRYLDREVEWDRDYVDELEELAFLEDRAMWDEHQKFLAGPKYDWYISRSKTWRFRSALIIKAYRMCWDCGRRDVVLEVHHRTYKRLFRECWTDLVPLCRVCHQYRHETGQVAAFKVPPRTP